MENVPFKSAHSNPSTKAMLRPVHSSLDTGGKFLLLDMEMQPGGYVRRHFHPAFVSTFHALHGVLGLKRGWWRKVYLQPGETAVVQKDEVHAFFNPGRNTIRFQVRIEPGSENFLQSLIVGYGLAQGGLTNKHGVPKNLDHLAVLLKMSNAGLPGVFRLFAGYLRRRALAAERRGVREQLLQRYYRRPVS